MTSGRVEAERAWTLLADILLQRAALVARIAGDRAPSALAGLKVDDDDVDRLLAELPGLMPRSAGAEAEIEEMLAGPVEEARVAFAEGLDSDGPFAQLIRTAGLSVTEAEVLAMLCAVEIDPRRQRLVGYLNDDVTQSRVSLWSLTQLFGPHPDALMAVGPGGGLRRGALLAPPSEAPWAAAPLALAPMVLWWLSGARSPDPDLPAGVEAITGPGLGTETLVTAAGPDRVRRLQAAVGVLRSSTFLATPLPDTPSQWDAVIRQATLAGAGVLLEVDATFPAVARDRIERTEHLVWGITSPFDLPLGVLPRRPWTDVRVDPGAATAAEWEAAFGPRHDHAYRLTADQLHLVHEAARAMGGDVPAAVRRLATGHIDAAATRVRPTRGWDDIVLDADRLSQLREVAVRCRQRDTVFGDWGFSPQPSTGVAALFAGPSGTGKTLAAEVIAADLGVDLYKVDLANLVSKYIGETEKNLSGVFDAAEASNVALFFDEADALLARRSDVSDAHDRYANIEVAHLLQRLERYEGLVVLATNLAANIDPAFIRRLHLVIDFPMPGPGERRRIWARCIPANAPTAGDLDLDALADHFELSGGTIRNTVLSAAFLAAEAGSAISMATALKALRRELQKMGRLVSEADFAPFSYLDAPIDAPSTA